MSDLMLLDVGAALSLQQRMAAAADGLDSDAHALAEPMAEASQLLGQPLPDVASEVRQVASDMHESAEDLLGRIRMVRAGGRDMNAGLAALERIRADFTLIETRGDTGRADGKLGLGDLEWARHQLGGEVGEAAGWLADHEEFFARVETAKDNDAYINKPYDNDFAYDRKDADGVLRIGDIDAFTAKTAAWAALLPHARAIDTAHKGGRPDGMLSRKDFEAFLQDYDVTPEVAEAVRRVLDDGAYHRNDGLISWGKVLDGLSFVPVIGDIVDGGRAIHHALHGDWQAAGVYALGLVPLPGLSGSGVKAGMTVVRSAVRGVRKSGYRQAAQETGKVLYKGTTYNWTASTAAEALTSSNPCASTRGWIAEQAGVEVTKFDDINDGFRRTTGEDFHSVRNRLADATGHNLGVMDGFFSDSCEVIARRLGEHKLSKMWLPKAR